MNIEQFKDYEQILDTQENLIKQLNATKEKRNKIVEQFKQDKNYDEFDNQLFLLEIEVQSITKKMQENFEKIKKLQSELNDNQ